MDDPKQILVIEDEPTLLNMLAMSLEKAGFGVYKSSDAGTALEMAKDNEPDLILLDILLPNGDGEILLKTLHSDEKTKGIPVIVLTNLADEELKKRCEAIGCKDYIVKADYRIDQLIERIKKTVP